MPEMMPAFRIVRWGHPPELTEAPIPEPGPGQVLIRVAGNGLCHSDDSMSQLPGEIAEAIGWRAPFTLGHEIGGWVDALGPGVTMVAEGQAVALLSPTSCGVCRYCQRGATNACPDGLVGRGYGRDGGLAPYVLARADRDLITLDRLDPVSAGPLTDAGATTMHGVRKLLPVLGPGSVAVVLGAGGLGAFALQFLRAMTPATVVAVDPNPARLAYAAELGAHHQIEGVTPGTAGEIRALVGDGVDGVLDLVGIDATIECGLACLRPGGAYGLIGAANGTLRRPWYGALPRDGYVFSFQGSDVSDAHDAIALADAGRIRVDIDTFALSKVGDAYAAMHEGRLRGRAVVVPD